MSKICAIHQPNFFPHYAFFEKMQQSDKFILLTHCQFEKNNYQNRFNMNNQWHTMSVNRGLHPIKDKRYINPIHDWETIKHKLPQYDLSCFDKFIDTNLSRTNIAIIKEIAFQLHIKTEIIIDQPLYYTSTERLVRLCKIHGATKYLSGASGKNYMDMELFERNGIEVLFQEQQPSKPILEVLYD